MPLRLLLIVFTHFTFYRKGEHSNKRENLCKILKHQFPQIMWQGVQSRIDVGAVDGRLIEWRRNRASSICRKRGLGGAQKNTTMKTFGYKLF